MSASKANCPYPDAPMNFLHRITDDYFDVVIVAMVAVVFWMATMGGLYYLFTFRQDLIVNGTIATISTAFILFLSSKLPKIRTNARRLFAPTLLFLHKHRVLALVATAVLAATSTWVTQTMLKDYVNRYKYVKLIKSAVKNDVFESLQIPDPEQLAQSFLLAPSRPESALLLIRSSRIFQLADDDERFKQYQRQFVSKIVDAINSGQLHLCNENTELYDPVLFIALAQAETAYTTDQVGPGTSKPQEDEQKRRAVAWSLKLLDECEGGSIDRSLYILKMREAVASAGATPEFPTSFDLDAALAAFEAKLHGLTSAEAVNFYRRHAYQEYVDFLAYLDTKKIFECLQKTGQATPPTADCTSTRIDELLNSSMDNYRKILMLRLRLAKSGTVIWHTTPSKLTLYHLFARQYGFPTNVTSSIFSALDKACDSDEKQHVVKRLTKFVELPAFSAFRNPSTWAKSSPLDYDLEGSSLVDKLDQWLLQNW